MPQTSCPQLFVCGATVSDWTVGDSTVISFRPYDLKARGADTGSPVFLFLLQRTAAMQSRVGLYTEPGRNRDSKVALAEVSANHR